MKGVFFWLVAAIFLLAADTQVTALASTIDVFCGAASKPAMEEAARTFTERTGTKVNLQFGGSGTVLSQMKMARRGDVYAPGSPDFMVKAEREKLIDPQTIRIIAYLIPAIGVQSGNPKNIRSLNDLARPGITVGIGNPQAVCVGLYAVELLERKGILNRVMENVVTQAHSCAATEALVAMRKVDAVIGWDVFSKWNPGTIETIALAPSEVPRIAYIPAAVSIYTKQRDSALSFINFLVSTDGKRIFSKWGYITTEEGARPFAPSARIGGEYMLPSGYKGR
jgi:molybdate transport system substrate-binding protein